MADPSDLILVDVKWSLSVSVILGIEWKAIEFFLDIVSQNIELGNSTVESFCGWNISNISQTENVVILNMLKGSWIDIQKSGRVG